MEVYKKAKPSLDVLKEFRGVNSAYKFPSDPSHSAILEINEMQEVPNLMPNSTAVHGDPKALISTGTGTSSYREDNISNNVENGEVNSHPENQSECDSGIMENNTSGGIEASSSPPPICLEDEDVDMERWNKLMETQDEMVSNSQSVIQIFISLGTRH